jgi:tetratricopeptide (TPR) repeat protein
MRMHRKLIIYCIVAGLSTWCGVAAQTDTRRQIQDHFERAQTALKANQLDSAADEFRQILELDTKSAAAHANLGMIAYRQTKYAEAVRWFSAAVQLNPSLWDAQAFLGISHVRLSHGREAQPFLQQSFQHIQNQSLRTEVGLHLIRIAQESNTLGSVVDVLQDLQRSVPNDPEVLYAAYRVHSDLAAHALESLAKSAPDSARLHQILAQAALTQDDVAGAIAEYRKVLQIDPHVPGAHLELGRAIIQASQDEAARQEAQQEFETELAANPRDADSEYELGQIYSLRSNLEAAEKHYSRALELRPELVDAHLALGKILSGKSDEEAFAHFREAARLDPGNEVAHYRLSQAYRKTGNNDEADREQAIFKKLRDSHLPSHSVYSGKNAAGATKANPQDR